MKNSKEKAIEEALDWLECLTYEKGNTLGDKQRLNKLRKMLEETPKAYKNIEDVMKSQEDLVEIKYELKQVLCIKG